MFIDELYGKFKTIGQGSTIKPVDYEKLFLVYGCLIDYIAFCDVSELRSFIYSFSREELYDLHFSIKMVIFRLITLQMPEDVETLELAINDLSWFVRPDEEFLADLKYTLKNLKNSSSS